MTTTKPKTSRVYTVDQARDAVLATIAPPTQSETIALHHALNRVSAKDTVANQSIPPFQNSAMDGYAIRHQDLQLTSKFKVTGKSLAGHPHTGKLQQNCAIKITTGAFVPPGSDTIVIVENTTVDGEHIIVNQPPALHQYIRNPGDDTHPGALVIPAFKQLQAADLGLLAAQGLSATEVFKQPTIGVFSTGDELLTPDQKPGPGKIYDSNRITIQSLLKNAGFDSIDLGIARDTEEDIQKVISDGNRCNFILSSGGVSVGEADLVKSVLEANGELFFWKVAMKPGKPMVTGKLNSGAYYFGLPGNPVSSMVTCIQFVIPAIQAFCGLRYQPPVRLNAVCSVDLHKEPGRFEFQRGFSSIGTDGTLNVSTTGLQDSHVLTSMGQANCFICLEANSEGAKAGSLVNIVLFSSLSGF